MVHYLHYLFYRSSILWTKGNKRIPVGKKGQRERRRRRRRRLINNQKGGFFFGNAFVTKKGTLQIRKVEIKDGGVYTCMGKPYINKNYTLDKSV